MLNRIQEIQHLSESIKKLKVEPPYSAGDCGYKAIIIGLFYLSLKAAAQPDQSLESKAISTVLKSSPNSVYNWLLRSNLIKEDATNAEILRAFVNGLNKKFMFNLTEIYDELIPKLKIACSNSEWLYHLIKEILTSGLWESFDIANAPSLKKLENKIWSALIKLTDNEKIISLDEMDTIKTQARSKVIASLPEVELKKIISDITKEIFLKENTWLDMLYLKKLSEQLLCSENILFDNNGININDNGPLNYHWYIDLPDDQYSQYLIEASKNQILIVDKLTIHPSIKLEEKSHSNQISDNKKSPQKK